MGATPAVAHDFAVGLLWYQDEVQPVMHTEWLSTHPVWTLACIACTLRDVQFTCIKLIGATKTVAMFSLLKLQADAHSFTCQGLKMQLLILHDVYHGL